MFQIKHLILIAGPSCAGKSYLIDKIYRLQCLDLCDQLNISNPLAWRYIMAKDLENIRDNPVDRLVVHYDLYAQYMSGKGFNHLDELLANAKNVTILTLYTPRIILLTRLFRRFIRELPKDLMKYIAGHFWLIEKDVLFNKIRCSGILKTYKMYKKGFSETLYSNWFEQLVQFRNTQHWQLSYKAKHATRIRTTNVADELQAISLRKVA